MKTCEWHDKISESYFCDVNGKILGSITRMFGDIYMARYNNMVLGKYISLTAAKNAVEAEYQCNYV
jgi:hypothetical protein